MGRGESLNYFSGVCRGGILSGKGAWLFHCFAQRRFIGVSMGYLFDELQCAAREELRATHCISRVYLDSPSTRGMVGSSPLRKTGLPGISKIRKTSNSVRSILNTISSNSSYSNKQ